MISRKNIQTFTAVIISCIFCSCDKVSVNFTDDNSTDPNITYLDNYKTEIATYKPDSMLTSSYEVFSIGRHIDPVFGKIEANSYAELRLPLSNTVLNQSVLFDSLELLLKPNGQFYGDSSTAFKLKVYQLSQIIQNTVIGDSYYNTSSFPHDFVPIGQQTFSLFGKTGEVLHTRLSDITGQELLNKFQSGSEDISTQEYFANYFKGLFIEADPSVTGTVAYFTSPTDSVLVRLHYHENVVSPSAKYLDLYFMKEKQFNHVSFDHSGTIFNSVFQNNTSQLIASSNLGNQAFLNSNLNTSIKITFPNLLDLKELHPYIKIIKAELIIKPDLATMKPPYSLPKTLNIYVTDNSNAPGQYIYDPVTGYQENGNLHTDELYNENNYYSFNITNFINTKIIEGQFSTLSLLLSTSLSSNDAGIQRLIINDQSKSNSIQLKLYVLGL